ncbi:glycosyltransferase family 2 protein [Vibrio sp. MA40-2]|uniref:glycosyltransferase family 2 protein n=1 Tax=Vibrio sp. MA40-2 TaxID=3391828 RepID=UPI0039A4CF9C
MKLSIVIPVFRSEKFVRLTVEKVREEISKFESLFEIILVDDGSPDGSWHVIEVLAKEYKEVKSIKLVKNYGQHTAVLCGIENAAGDFIITMDDDLQNPPEDIPILLNKIEQGYDLVFAKFKQKKHASYRKLGTKIIGYLNDKIFNKPKDITLTNYRIFTKNLAERIVAYRVNEPYIPGLLLMHASSIANVETEHRERTVGGSNYTISKILKLVSRLLFNYSSVPLKALSFIGGAISLFSFLGGIFALMNQLISGSSVQGWTTLVVLLSFLNGFIILMLGVLGEYVIRLTKTISHERPYHISRIVK